MSDIKNEQSPPKKEIKEMAIPTTEIVKLKELKKYSKDYLNVLLPKPVYKPSEAIAIVKNYFKD